MHPLNTAIINAKKQNIVARSLSSIKSSTYMNKRNLITVNNISLHSILIDSPVIDVVGEMVDGLARGGGEKAPDRYPPRSASACFALSTLSLSLWKVLPQVRPRYGQFSCLTPAAVTPAAAAAAPAPEAPFNSSAPAYEQLALSYITKEPLKN